MYFHDFTLWRKQAFFVLFRQIYRRSFSTLFNGESVAINLLQPRSRTVFLTGKKGSKSALLFFPAQRGNSGGDF
jgi:hypothetical protein